MEKIKYSIPLKRKQKEAELVVADIYFNYSKIFFFCLTIDFICVDFSEIYGETCDAFFSLKEKKMK